VNEGGAEWQPGHVPVLGPELVALAGAVPGCTVVDGTFGAGGHARMLADAMNWSGSYCAVDRDPSAETAMEIFAREGAARNLAVTAVRDTFPSAFRALAREGVSADVAILDLGTSSMQLDQPERGFSYAHDAPLDMRMDTSGGSSARDLLATVDEAEIARVLFEFGEERHARRIAREIVRRRERKPLATTSDLVAAVESAVPRAGRRPGHVAKRTFQALRIAVNEELGMVDDGLDAAFDLLAPGGRLVVIAFHSLEDRIVKQRFQSWLGMCICPPGLPVCGCGATAQVELLTRKPIVASDEENAANRRAASAKLRAVRKLEVA
jgi:16S rRNA (cytosine1402-N4)-methyltransferase